MNVITYTSSFESTNFAVHNEDTFTLMVFIDGLLTRIVQVAEDILPSEIFGYIHACA